MLDSAAENFRAERIGQDERKTTSQRRHKMELGCGE